MRTTRQGDRIVHRLGGGRSDRREHDLHRPCKRCRPAEPLRILDLFCGEKNWSQPARDRGHHVITSDFDDRYEPDIVADVMALDPDEIVRRLGGSPTLILASPPCQGFTVARIGANWTKTQHGKRYIHRLAETEPKTPKAALGIQLVQATLDLVEALRPAWWLMENPVGKLRKLPVVAGIPRRTVTYCRYLRPMRKPTDLWGVAPPSMFFEPPCDAYNGPEVEVDGVRWRTSASTGEPCHESAPRGSTTGTQGRVRLDSTAVPYALAWDVIVAAERDWEAGLAGETAGQEVLFA